MSGNPVLPGWYADPELHWFEGRFWIYPTTSAKYDEQTYFEAWSATDLAEWQHEGTILSFADVPWSTNRAAWAPSMAFKNGRYHFYFSAGDGAGLGVAVSDCPQGPFVDALGHPLVIEYHHGAQPIDAHCFLDDDGQAYLYWGGWSHAVVARLSDDMLSLAEPPREVTPEGYVEGSFMLRRAGRYYFMWSEGSWGDPTYGVAYAMSDSPYGPFHREGVVLRSDHSLATSAGHHSVLRLPDEDRYVIAYHRRPLGETDRDHRVTCLDWMEFEEDGRIKPVVMTHEGVRKRERGKGRG
jgi:beta-xylosidase